MNDPAAEPEFLLPSYVTITRDPRTQLVLAIGGNQRAAGILQTTGGFTHHPGPSIHYHRQPVTMSVERQRLGATASSYALLAAGYSVYLAPDLNVLATPDGDREAAYRYLTRLTELARSTTETHVLAGVMAETAAPETGVLPRLREVLVAVWTAWGDQLREQGDDPEPADRLMDVTSVMSNMARNIEDLRTKAAHAPPPLKPAKSPPSSARTANETSPRRR